MKLLTILFLILGSFALADDGGEIFYKLDPKTFEYHEPGLPDPDPKRPKLIGWYVDAKYENPDPALVKEFMDVLVMKDLTTPFGPVGFRSLFAFSIPVEGKRWYYCVSPECRKLRVYRGDEVMSDQSISEEAATKFLKFYQLLTKGK